MDNEDPDPQKQPERPSSPFPANILLYVMIAVVGVVILSRLLGASRSVEIHYGELVRLIQQGVPAENSNAFIEVEEGAGDSRQTVRYSNLSNIKIGTYEISAKVTRQVMRPEQKAAKDDVAVRINQLGPTTDNNYLFLLLTEKGFTGVTGQEPPNFWSENGPMLLSLMFLVGITVLVMRRLGSTGGAMAFGRSRGKLIAQEEIEVTFDDAAGIDEAVDELREVVEFLQKPQKYQALGGRIPKGVLLVGPPGTGKTLLAKAVAGEAGVPFFSISGSDFVEMFVGVGAARVRDMFQQAEARSPCIIFIDELDALGKTRGSGLVGGHDEREQTLNALLVEMDGFNSNSGTIVMAATNRPETLDPALLRAGRFDRQVLVDRPDIRGREQILKVHVKNVKLDEDVDLKKIAGITSGFVGADLAALVNEAALLAARNDKKSVTIEEFNEGVERVTTGLEKRQRIIHEDEKLRVAYHESSHALVAFSLPNTDPVHKVSIIPRGLAALGYTMQRPEGDRYLRTQSELESQIQVLLAGTIGEELIFDDISTGAQNDLQRATEIARAMVMEYGMSRLGRVNYRENNRNIFLGGGVGAEFPPERHHSERTAREIDEEIRHIIDDLLEKVRHILQTRREALVALAERLLEIEVLDADELKQIIDAASPNPMIVPGTSSAKKRPSSSADSSEKRPPKSDPGKASG